MSQPPSDPPSPSIVEGARSMVLEWLREEPREPRFLLDEPRAELAGSHRRIADRFLFWIEKSGFDAELVEVQQDEGAAFEVHWTHHGATFVGFKQAPPAGKPEDALLLACAALLKNDWCRKQVEQ